MAFRMKRNGAGLASICILATMVLVTLSSTASLFFGAEDSLHSRYPRQLNAVTGLHSLDDLADGPMQTLRAAWTEQLDEAGVTPTAVDDYRCATAAGQLFGSQMKLIGQDGMYSNMDSNYYSVYFVPLSDYNASMGTHETLQPGEALIYLSRGSYNEPQISFDQRVARLRVALMAAAKQLRHLLLLQRFELGSIDAADLHFSLHVSVPPRDFGDRYSISR